jgi:hypothetical protein
MSSQRTIKLCGQDLHAPGHICAFFDSRDQQYDVLSPYYQEGLDQGEEVLTIVDANERENHCRRMRDRGVPVDAAMANGQLQVFSSEETYTIDGRFESDRMFKLLEGALASSKQRGHRVRTSGVMDWTARGYPGTTELLDYESHVNVLVPEYDCTLLCVYDLVDLSGPMVMDILRTHPFVIHGHNVLQNPYYTPPVQAMARLA